MDKKNLVIVGAGGCAREALQWAKDVNRAGERWNIKGFLCDYPDPLKGKKCDVPVLDTIDGYEIGEDDEFVVAIGDSTGRKMVTDKLKARGARLVNLIHPSAVIADSCSLGEGLIIYPFALISDNARIGDGCIINMYSSVAHDSVLGEYCTISAHCDVTGRCTLGDRVFMGSSSQVVPDSRIGNDVFICAGSTVMTRLRDGVKVLGNPAKLVKF